MQMAFVSAPPAARAARRPRSICARVTMSLETVQGAKRALLSATNGLNLGRAISDDPAKVAHMESLISDLEREWKQETTQPTELRLAGRRELLYTTLPDVLAAGKPQWQQCNVVYHTIDDGDESGTIEQRFSLGPIQLPVAFRFELGMLQSLGVQTLKRKITFVEVRVGGVLRFDMRKQNLVGRLEVRYLDEDLLVLEGNKGSVSVLKLVHSKAS